MGFFIKIVSQQTFEQFGAVQADQSVFGLMSVNIRCRQAGRTELIQEREISVLQGIGQFMQHLHVVADDHRQALFVFFDQAQGLFDLNGEDRVNDLTFDVAERHARFFPDVRLLDTGRFLNLDLSGRPVAQLEDNHGNDTADHDARCQNQQDGRIKGRCTGDGLSGLGHGAFAHQGGGHGGDHDSQCSARSGARRLAVLIRP